MQYQAHIPFLLTNKFIEKLGYTPDNQSILVIRDLFTAMYLATKNAVTFVTDDAEAAEQFKKTVMLNPCFGADDAVIYIDVESNKNAWLEFIEDLKTMPKYHVCISNPPYQFGNKIFNVLKDKCDKSVVIMPLNQYKGGKLYQHIESFELADPKVFEAVITENLNISVVKKDAVNKFTWQELVLESCDQRYNLFYRWNVEHNINVKMERCDSKSDVPLDGINIDTHFVESGRCVTAAGGSGFGESGYGYRWNVTKQNVNTGWLHCAGIIKFNTIKKKNNFAKFWYSNKKGKSLISKVALGLHIVSISADYYFFIPQIDWETIDQHPLWNTDVDAAVLDTMGLKWNTDKTSIIEK